MNLHERSDCKERGVLNKLAKYVIRIAGKLIFELLTGLKYKAAILEIL
jgi:hypothetical protein